MNHYFEVNSKCVNGEWNIVQVLIQCVNNLTIGKLS